jgi:hypothetical protein
MRETRSYGSVGARGGNEPRYPENSWPVFSGFIFFWRKPVLRFYLYFFYSPFLSLVIHTSIPLRSLLQGEVENAVYFRREDFFR